MIRNFIWDDPEVILMRQELRQKLAEQRYQNEEHEKDSSRPNAPKTIDKKI